LSGGFGGKGFGTKALNRSDAREQSTNVPARLLVDINTYCYTRLGLFL
jgi:hypothetical protein